MTDSQTTATTTDAPLPELSPQAGAASGAPIIQGGAVLPLIGDVKVRLTARLGEAELTVSELTQLRAGSTLALDREVNQVIDLMIDGHVVAQGTLVAVGDQYGVRITSAAQG